MATREIKVQLDPSDMLDKLHKLIDKKVDEFHESELAECAALLDILVNEWGIEKFRELGQVNLQAHRLMQSHVCTY